MSAVESWIVGGVIYVLAVSLVIAFLKGAHVEEGDE